MTLQLEIENIAGIRQGTAQVDPGINAVQGSNWQGKSSLIAAIKTAMGTATPLTEGARTGKITLTTADGTIVTELRRENGRVVRSGDYYLQGEQDRVCAELFAFLDENNAIRRAVQNNEALEELLIRPLDFENIDEQIAEYQRERDRVETELERAQTAVAKLPTQQEQVTQLETTLDELRSERDELIGTDDTDQDIEAKRDELSDVRAERDQIRDRISRLEDTTERTRDRLSNARTKLDELKAPAKEEIDSELAEERETLNGIERDVELLQSVFEANKRVLDEQRLDLLTDVEHGLMDDTVTCWVCGNQDERDAFTAHLNHLQDRIGTLQEDAASYRKRVDDLQTAQQDIQNTQRQITDLENEIADLTTTLTDREESLSTAKDRLEELSKRADELTEEVADTDSRLTDIESEIKYTQREIDDAQDELETLESHADSRDMLASERDELTQRIEELRTRKERTKRRTREAFDSAIEDILSRFDVGFEAARLTTSSELVVAREGREAPLDTLSEGERELLGIVTALAGHAAFNVGDRVPVLLLDGLGGIAKDHLHMLVGYLHDRSDYLVVTAYPEHGSFDGRALDPSEWTVVADDRDVHIST